MTWGTDWDRYVANPAKYEYESRLPRGVATISRVMANIARRINVKGRETR